MTGPYVRSGPIAPRLRGPRSDGGHANTSGFC